MTCPQCRWDLLKRVPKELADHIIARAQNFEINDKDVLAHYREYKAWQRYKHAWPLSLFSASRLRKLHQLAQLLS